MTFQLKINFSPFSKLYFFPLAAGGALLFFYLENLALAITGLILALLLSLLAVFIYLKKKYKSWLLFLLALAVGFGLSSVRLITFKNNFNLLWVGLPLNEVGGFKAFLTKDSVLTASNRRLYTCEIFEVSNRREDQSTSACGLVNLYVKDGPELFTGSILEVKASLKEAELKEGSRFLAFSSKDKLIFAGFNNSFLEWRASIIKLFSKNIKKLGEPQSGLIEALFLGIKDNLDFKLRDSFTKSGSLHLLALSGLHVGIIASLLFILLNPLGFKRLRIIIVDCFILFYLFIVGPEPSLLRATLMFFLASLALILDHEPHLPSLLGLTALIVLIIDPQSVYTVSFKLSYLALIGIITLGRRLNKFLVPYLPCFLRSLLSASIAAQLFTAPVALAEFQEFYPFAFIAALLLIPLTTVFLYFSLIFFALSFIPFAFILKLAQFILNLGYDLLARISYYFSFLPALKINWQSFYWLPALFILLILAFRLPFQKENELRFEN